MQQGDHVTKLSVVCQLLKLSGEALAKDCGLVFEAGNPAALRDALLRLKNEQTLAAALSAAAKDAFLREYSAERFAREIDEVYENALRFQ